MWFSFISCLKSYSNYIFGIQFQSDCTDFFCKLHIIKSTRSRCKIVVDVSVKTRRPGVCVTLYTDIYKSTDKVSELTCLCCFSQPGCKVALFLSNYCILANYSWLLVEGHYLHSLINLSLHSHTKRLHCYTLLGWGTLISLSDTQTIFHSIVDDWRNFLVLTPDFRHVKTISK